MDTKRCLRCGEEIPLTQFYSDKRKKDGKSPYCKKCSAEMKGHTYTPPEDFPEGQRRCTKCKEIKSLEEFHKTAKGTFGRSAVCKKCRSRAKAKPIPQEGYRFCSKCGEEKPNTPEFFVTSRGKITSECRICSQLRAKTWFSKKKEQDPDYSKKAYYRHAEANRARARRYYQTHKEQHRERDKQWKERNQERHSVYKKSYYAENRGQIINRVRQWRKDNPERYRGYNREWLDSNPEVADAIQKSAQQRRRARKRNLPNTFTTEEWMICLTYWQYRCAVCGSDNEIHADHWIPLADENSPGTVKENMIVLCSHCNHTKWATDAETWLVKKLGVDEAAKKLAEIHTYFEYVKFINME